MELLQIVTAFLYYKVRHGLLQIATGITKCNGFVTNCDRYYKKRWLLQIATVHLLLLSSIYRRWIRLDGSLGTNVFSKRGESAWITAWEKTIMSQRITEFLFPCQLTILSLTRSKVTSSGKFLWEIGRTVEHGLMWDSRNKNQFRKRFQSMVN